MPNKTNELHKYHVHSPEVPMEKAFECYLVNYWKMQSWEQMNDWLCQYPHYAEPSIWQRTSPRDDNPEEESTLNGKTFISCPTYFSRYSGLVKPFSIVRGYLLNNASPRIEVIANESQISEIQNAIDQVHPYKWPQMLQFYPSTKCFQCYLFGCHIWSLNRDEETASEEELRLLFLYTVDTERQRFERLKRKFSGISGGVARHQREPIPEYVRIYVWRRDQGRCVQCNSSERLEYDHIIPVSKGGSNTERNIQLLCELCNRKKSSAI